MTKRRLAFLATCLITIAALTGLGAWQLQRLAWKNRLIATVDDRIHSPPAPAPAPSDPVEVYRPVSISGRFLQDKRTFVQAVTRLGAGFWVMTPLRSDRGFTVLVNRGFVPPDKRDLPDGDAAQTVRVTGLLRLTEPGGGFLRHNDPADDRWYSRDVAAIAQARGLNDVAPYLIDADATPNPGGLPVGGLTVVQFPNSHLQYALTWFALAAMLAGWLVNDLRTGGSGRRSRRP